MTTLSGETDYVAIIAEIEKEERAHRRRACLLGFVRMWLPPHPECDVDRGPWHLLHCIKAAYCIAVGRWYREPPPPPGRLFHPDRYESQELALINYSNDGYSWSAEWLEVGRGWSRWWVRLETDGEWTGP